MEGSGSESDPAGRLYVRHSEMRYLRYRNMTRPDLSRLPKWLGDKYFLTAAFFVAWMLFFDHNDLILQWKRSRELETLKDARDHYTGQIVETRKQLEEMRSSPIAVERIAREKYLMKKDGEEVFVITPGDR